MIISHTGRNGMTTTKHIDKILNVFLDPIIVLSRLGNFVFLTYTFCLTQQLSASTFWGLFRKCAQCTL